MSVTENTEQATVGVGLDPPEIDHEAIAAKLARPGFFKRNVWSFVFVVELIAIFAVWQFIAGTLEWFNPKFVPPPSDVFTELWNMLPLVGDDPITEHIVFSVRNFIVGYIIAAVVGISIGLLIGATKVGELLLSPLVWTAYAVPRSALAPVIVLVWGLGMSSKVVIIFLLAVFPVIVNTMEGARHVETSLLNAGKVFGASRTQQMRKVFLPAVLPFMLIGLRIAVVRGYIGVLIGELVGSFKGLGTILRTSAFNFETSVSLAVVIILVVFANITMLGVSFAKKKLAPWHSEEDVLKSR